MIKMEKKKEKFRYIWAMFSSELKDVKTIEQMMEAAYKLGRFEFAKELKEIETRHLEAKEK